MTDTVWELVPGLPRLLVTVWRAGADRQDLSGKLRGLLDGSGADTVPGVSHPLYTSLSNTPELGLRPDRPRPTYWYALLHAPRDASDQEHPVRGPLPLPAVRRFPHRALVYVGPDRTPTLDAPDGPASEWRYYEVDLVERSIFVGPVPRTWAAVRVVDPVEAVRHADDDLREQLAERLAEESARLPRPLDTEKLERRLTRWKLPGYAVRWTVSPSAVPRRSTVMSDLVETLATADCFLLGFDGTLVDLYSTTWATREAVDELKALQGVSLPAGVLTQEEAVHPMDILRAFAHRPRLARPLAERLAAIESRALHTARPVDGGQRLVSVLNRSGRPVSVVSDVDPGVLLAFLRSRSLHRGTTFHGRDPEYRLLPDPAVIRRALDASGNPPQRAVLIGSTHVEPAAARDLGVPFIGHAASERTRAGLVAAGAQLAVPSLGDLAEVARRHL
ncbi:HAD family hydrolase [Streptomyces broussonetiae]|uniref:HAD family hydrolase n=1 Tax=Streptomyces broussonetiae TaxID=2686304 RepID=A0ABV5E3H3_9ACTN